MSKVRLTGSNSGYVEIAAVADAGNLSFTMPTHGTALLGNGNNVYTGITTFNGATIFNDDVTFDGATAGYDVVWDRSDNQLEFADHAKISMGSGGDLLLYHDGNHSYIDDAGQGNLRLRSGTLEIQNLAGNKTSAVFSSGSGQTLNFNNNTKFVTTNTGVVVTGICTATSFSGDGEGLTRTTQLSHRRMNVNGAMSVCQKDSTATGNANNGYPICTDMVNYRRTGAWSGTTWTVSQNSQTPTTLSPFTYFTRWTQAGTVQNAPNDTSTKLQYGIEGQDMAHAMWGTSSAKQCTLSFYVRCSQTGTFCIWLTNTNNNYNYIIEYTISTANTWQRVTHTIPGPTSGTFNTSNSAAIKFYFIIAAHAASGTYGGGTKNVWNTSGRWTSNQSTAVSANAGATWDITGIQFEIGDTATPFEHRSYHDELKRCRRYFCRYVGNLNINFVNEHPSNKSGYINFPFYETMRIAPTVTVGSNVSIARPQVPVTQKVESVDSISTDCFNVIRWTSQAQLGSTGDASYRMTLSAGDSNSVIDCNAEL